MQKEKRKAVIHVLFLIIWVIILAVSIFSYFGFLQIKASIEAIDIVIEIYWIVIHLYHLIRDRKMRKSCLE